MVPVCAGVAIGSGSRSPEMTHCKQPWSFAGIEYDDKGQYPTDESLAALATLEALEQKQGKLL